MAEVVALLRRDALAQLHLHLERVLAAVGDAQQAGNADTVGVADVALFSVDVPQDEIGGLAPHAGEAEKVLHGVRHPPAVFLHQHLAGGYDVPGLGPPEAGGVDDFPDLLLAGVCQGLQGGEFGVEDGGHHIHPGVGTLRCQTHGKKELIGLSRVEGEGALGGGV